MSFPLECPLYTHREQPPSERAHLSLSDIPGKEAIGCSGEYAAEPFAIYVKHVQFPFSEISFRMAYGFSHHENEINAIAKSKYPSGKGMCLAMYSILSKSRGVVPLAALIAFPETISLSVDTLEIRRHALSASDVYNPAVPLEGYLIQHGVHFNTRTLP